MPLTRAIWAEWLVVVAPENSSGPHRDLSVMNSSRGSSRRKLCPLCRVLRSQTQLGAPVKGEAKALGMGLEVRVGMRGSVPFTLHEAGV